MDAFDVFGLMAYLRPQPSEPLRRDRPAESRDSLPATPESLAIQLACFNARFAVKPR